MPCPSTLQYRYFTGFPTTPCYISHSPATEELTDAQVDSIVSGLVLQKYRKGAEATHPALPHPHRARRAVVLLTASVLVEFYRNALHIGFRSPCS